LCSSSKTRAKLLKNAGIRFVSFACDFDEDVVSLKDPYEFVVLVSYGKFKECLKNFEKEDLVAADTVVSDGEKILRKAKNEEEAKYLLSLQSGRKIKIITAMWVRFEGRIFSRVDETVYEFEKFDENDMKEYIKSGEWKGKAGACMVEGFCKKYIKKVEGYESTAMGLCVEELIKIIGEKHAYSGNSRISEN
jgi:septum formation protein